MSNNTYKAFDFYKENEFIVHNNDGSTNIVTMKTIPAGVPENVAKIFPTLDKKVIDVPKKSKPNTQKIFIRWTNRTGRIKTKQHITRISVFTDSKKDVKIIRNSNSSTSKKSFTSNSTGICSMGSSTGFSNTKTHISSKTSKRIRNPFCLMT